MSGFAPDAGVPSRHGRHRIHRCRHAIRRRVERIACRRGAHRAGARAVHCREPRGPERAARILYSTVNGGDFAISPFAISPFAISPFAFSPFAFSRAAMRPKMPARKTRRKQTSAVQKVSCGQSGKSLDGSKQRSG